MRKTEKKTIFENIKQIGEIVSIEKSKILLRKYFEKDEDETRQKKLLTLDDIDVIILCTGYQYSFPFLSADCGVSVLKPDLLSPLYKDTISLSRQTLGFIGVAKYGISILFEYQARFLKAFYEEKFKRPPYGKELFMLIEKDNKKKKTNDVDVENTPFNIPYYQFKLCNEIALEGDFEPLHEKFEIFFRQVLMKKYASETNFRNSNYEINSKGEFVQIF